MADLTVSCTYTQNSGQPATGLTLTDINIRLTQQDRVTGVDSAIWNTQNPTSEIDNCGAYIRILTTANLDTYNYFAAAEYVGATVLDSNWALGAISLNDVPIGTAIEFTYTITSTSDGQPIEGVRVVITSDSAGNSPVWAGNTDTFGVARDDNGNKPRLDAGTYFFFRNKPGYTFQDPDTESVS